MKANQLSATLIALGTIIFTPTIQAVPLTFDNEALFLSAAGTLALESFENETVPNPPNPDQTNSLVLTDFTLTSDTSFGVFDVPFFGQDATDGEKFIASIVNINTTSLAFVSPISAFGINILDFGDFGGSELTFSNGVDSYTAAVPVTNGANQFFGIIADYTFNTAMLSYNEDSGESYGIDEVYYTPISVPEPAAISLLGLGLLGLGLSRRRQLKI